MRIENDRLKQIIKELGVVPDERLESAFKFAEKANRSLADVLVESDLISDDHLGQIIAKELGYVKIPKGVLIDIKEIDKYPDSRLIIIGTGAQGEERAVLGRISSGEHRFIKLQKTDTVIFSSSIILFFNTPPAWRIQLF